MNVDISAADDVAVPVRPVVPSQRTRLRALELFALCPDPSRFTVRAASALLPRSTEESTAAPAAALCHTSAPSRASLPRISARHRAGTQRSATPSAQPQPWLSASQHPTASGANMAETADRRAGRAVWASLPGLQQQVSTLLKQYVHQMVRAVVNPSPPSAGGRVRVTTSDKSRWKPQQPNQPHGRPTQRHVPDGPTTAPGILSSLHRRPLAAQTHEEKEHPHRMREDTFARTNSRTCPRACDADQKGTEANSGHAAMGCAVIATQILTRERNAWARAPVMGTPPAAEALSAVTPAGIAVSSSEYDRARHSTRESVAECGAHRPCVPCCRCTMDRRCHHSGSGSVRCVFARTETLAGMSGRPGLDAILSAISASPALSHTRLDASAAHFPVTASSWHSCAPTAAAVPVASRPRATATPTRSAPLSSHALPFPPTPHCPDGCRLPTPTRRGPSRPRHEDDEKEANNAAAAAEAQTEAEEDDSGTARWPTMRVTRLRGVPYYPRRLYSTTAASRGTAHELPIHYTQSTRYRIGLCRDDGTAAHTPHGVMASRAAAPGIRASVAAAALRRCVDALPPFDLSSVSAFAWGCGGGNRWGAACGTCAVVSDTTTVGAQDTPHGDDAPRARRAEDRRVAAGRWGHRRRAGGALRPAADRNTLPLYATPTRTDAASTPRNILSAETPPPPVPQRTRRGRWRERDGEVDAAALSGLVSRVPLLEEDAAALSDRGTGVVDHNPPCDHSTRENSYRGCDTHDKTTSDRDYRDSHTCAKDLWERVARHRGNEDRESDCGDTDRHEYARRRSHGSEADSDYAAITSQLSLSRTQPVLACSQAGRQIGHVTDGDRPTEPDETMPLSARATTGRDGGGCLSRAAVSDAAAASPPRRPVGPLRRTLPAAVAMLADLDPLLHDRVRLELPDFAHHTEAPWDRQREAPSPPRRRRRRPVAAVVSSWELTGFCEGGGAAGEPPTAPATSDTDSLESDGVDTSAGEGGHPFDALDEAGWLGAVAAMREGFARQAEAELAARVAERDAVRHVVREQQSLLDAMSHDVDRLSHGDPEHGIDAEVYAVRLTTDVVRYARAANLREGAVFVSAMPHGGQAAPAPSDLRTDRDKARGHTNRRPPPSTHDDDDGAGLGYAAVTDQKTSCPSRAKHHGTRHNRAPGSRSRRRRRRGRGRGQSRNNGSTDSGTNDTAAAASPSPSPSPRTPYSTRAARAELPDSHADSAQRGLPIRFATPSARARAGAVDMETTLCSGDYVTAFVKGRVETAEVGCQVTEADLGYTNPAMHAALSTMSEVALREKKWRHALRLATVGLATVASFHASLEVESTCPACFCVLEHPCTLWPCGHTFCRHCLIPMYASGEDLVCVVCGTLCGVGYSPNCTAELMANYQVLREQGKATLGDVQTVEGVLQRLLEELLHVQQSFYEE